MVWYTGGMENNEQPVASPELVQKVQELVNVAFNDSVKSAIDQAIAAGPAVAEALHDALMEPGVHDELLKRGKIDPAA
jgi:hypothetical protein